MLCRAWRIMNQALSKNLSRNSMKANNLCLSEQEITHSANNKLIRAYLIFKLDLNPLPQKCGIRKSTTRIRGALVPQWTNHWLAKLEIWILIPLQVGSVQHKLCSILYSLYLHITEILLKLLKKQQAAYHPALCLLNMDWIINRFDTENLIWGHMQTAQTPFRCHRMWHLIRVFTLYYRNSFAKYKNIKPSEIPETWNRLIPLIKTDKTIHIQDSLLNIALPITWKLKCKTFT